MRTGLSGTSSIPAQCEINKEAPLPHFTEEETESLEGKGLVEIMRRHK